jgi:HPt (histidine-containing phosphotransfer) domain-containing protein
MKGDEVRCQEAGCSGYLPKPIDQNLLVETVVAALGNQPRETDAMADLVATVEARRLEMAVPNSAVPNVALPNLSLPNVAAPKAKVPKVDLPDEAGSDEPLPEKLHSTLPMDDVDFRAIVEQFVERLAEKFLEMDAAIAAREFAEVAALAHWLKGTGGTVGFHAFVEPAERLERLARGGQAAGLEAAVVRLRQIAERIVVE